MKHSHFFRTLFFTISFGILFSCANKNNLEEIDNSIKCDDSSLQITENDSIAISNSTNPVIWKGFYNSNLIEIYFTKNVGADGETETFTAVFSKIENCLKIDRAYKFYDGKQVDISAITEVKIIDFSINNWEIDFLFSGIIVYLDPHDKLVYTRKFWVKLIPENSKNTPSKNLFFTECLGNKMPINIDVNKDTITDFKLTYEETKDIGNKPNFSFFTIKLVSTNVINNQILSPIRGNSPYFVVFEPPFSSANTKQYFDGVKNELDIFYEFKPPYEKYNHYLSNNLTYREILSNNLKNYFIISLLIDGKTYFGWIQFQLDTASCKVEIVETFLNTTPNEAVFVN